MTANTTDSWIEANQRYLMAAFAVIREHLERCASSRSSDDGAGDHRSDESRSRQHVPDVVGPGTARIELERARQDLARPAPIDVLCTVFGLSDFERDLLLLCAGVEFDEELADACGAIQGSPVPTFGLALRALPGAAWGPLAPDAPLRRWHLIVVSAGATLASRPLRLDDYILHFILGLHSMEERLVGFVEPVESRGKLSPSQLSAVEHAAKLWSSELSAPVLSLCSSAATATRAAALDVCTRCGLQMYALHAADIPDLAAEQILAARLWERHAALSGAALLIEISRDAVRDKAQAFAERVHSPVLIASRDPVQLRNRTVVRVDINKPHLAEQHELWRDALGDRAQELSDQIAMVVSQFQLNGDEIEAVATEVRSHHERYPAPAENRPRSQDEVNGVLWRACRIQARPKLDELAQHIEARASWDDLIVSDYQRRQLREISAHVRHRARVCDGWGFARKSARGLGISALFSGPSGTGKTTAAEVIARDLHLDLFRIDLSSVVSKYIGETEKNLRRVFDAAEGGGAILLFDEADALFGKRSDVKDSHDRYANMEVSYLLQRMEAYRGLAILTSNLRDSLDSAFMRRLRFVIEFPFPSRDQRAEIWQRMFPDDTPTGDLDIVKLARLNLSGGNIRNVAMHGAFLAAQENAAIEMKHLQAAARTELAKLERNVPERELKDWT